MQICGTCSFHCPLWWEVLLSLIWLVLSYLGPPLPHVSPFSCQSPRENHGVIYYKHGVLTKVQLCYKRGCLYMHYPLSLVRIMCQLRGHAFGCSFLCLCFTIFYFDCLYVVGLLAVNGRFQGSLFS